MLEIENLYAGYGQGDVLHNLSLRVGEREAVCLLGRNGAGKSTILKAIMQLVQPRRGVINFRDQNLAGMPTYKVALSGVGYVPEDRRMFPGLTVRENLRVPRVGMTKGVIWPLERVFDVFPALRQRHQQLAGTLSGGEQQMLAIARALIGSPSLLLLDEPSEGLAPLMVHALINQIAQLKEQKLTILLSEQNLSFADALCDRVYIIDKGTIQFEGSLGEFKQDSKLQQRFLAVGINS